MTPKTAVNILLLCVFTGLAACSGDEDPPEQRIHKLNDNAEAAAEEKDAGSIEGMVAEDFKSAHLNKASIMRLVRMYMLRHKSIHLFSLTKSVQVVDEDNARAEVLVALAGKPVERVDQLFDLSAELLHFDVAYARFDNEWKVTALKWRRAAVDDFLQ